MNLFLCATPFQLFLAHKIAANLELKPEHALFVFIDSNHNETIINSLNEIRSLGFKVKNLKFKKKHGIKKYLNFIPTYIPYVSA